MCVCVCAGLLFPPGHTIIVMPVCASVETAKARGAMIVRATPFAVSAQVTTRSVAEEVLVKVAILTVVTLHVVAAQPLEEHAFVMSRQAHEQDQYN